MTRYSLYLTSIHKKLPVSSFFNTWWKTGCWVAKLPFLYYSHHPIHYISNFGATLKSTAFQLSLRMERTTSLNTVDIFYSIQWPCVGFSRSLTDACVRWSESVVLIPVSAKLCSCYHRYRYRRFCRSLVSLMRLPFTPLLLYYQMPSSVSSSRARR